MCGIAGIYKVKGGIPIAFDEIKSMTTSIAHRGPDGEGFYFNETKSLALGHRRLSIIDLTTGQQPMTDAANKACIVFNGEIYNYKELKKELISKGYLFKTNSDTEVLLNYYLEYGVSGLQRVIGIFAFAIYHIEENKIILVRDHFGVKPLYYYIQDNILVFGSELKTILASKYYKRELDFDALNSFLTYRFNPSPQTLFKGINKLEPGHYILFGEDQKFILDEFYTSHPVTDNKISFQDAVTQYQEKLELAVKRQMVSDVPVGLFLSGGIDSAIIGTLMQKNTSNAIKTFTVGFEGKGDFNELQDAKETAQFIGSEHSDHIISNKEYFENFSKSFYSLEEPISMTSTAALFSLSAFAAKSTKVVLTGQGADEPLAGYNRYYGEKLISKYHKLINLLPKKLINSCFGSNEKIERALYVSDFKNESDRFLAIYTIFNPELKKKLVKNELISVHKNISDADKKLFSNLYAQSKSLDDSLSRLLFIDTRFSLADNLLLLGDKISMASSLEARVPFLDLELVHFLETLPSEYKLKGSQAKYLHKKAIEKWLPDSIINRKKRGFDTPFNSWISSEIGEKMLNLLTNKNSACNQYFNIETIKEIFNSHRYGKRNYHRQIFILLSFEIWYKYYFENTTIDIAQEFGLK